MLKKQLSAFLDNASPDTWVVILPSLRWTGPTSFVKRKDGTWDDPDTLGHLWAAYRLGAVAATGVGADKKTQGWVW